MTIESRRIAQVASPPIFDGVTDAQRFGWRPSEEEAQRARQEPERPPEAPAFAFGLPDGWERLPETRFRQINTQIAGHPDAQCYLTWLPMDGGGDVANVNRWRDQVGLGPIDADAVAALPRGSLLGAEAIRVDVTGTFKGMLGEEVTDARLLGMLLTRRQGGALFVKFVGPAAVVGDNVEEFDAFVASIELASSPQAAPPQESRLAWSVPDGWEVEGGARPMREVTLLRGECEMYVTILGGGGGGVLANLNRWYGQVGAAPLGVSGLADLERVTALGGEGYVMEADGTLSAMGGTPREGWAIRGAAVEWAGNLVTVKLVGPAAEVVDAREGFNAFVTSLIERP